MSLLSCAEFWDVLSSVSGRGEDIIDLHSNVDYLFWILTVTTGVLGYTGHCFSVQNNNQQELNSIFKYLS
jgi:hypothetical protein